MTEKHYIDVKLALPDKTTAQALYKQIYSAMTGIEAEEIYSGDVNFYILWDVAPKERLQVWEWNQETEEDELTDPGVNDGLYYVLLRCTPEIASQIPPEYLTDKELSVQFSN